MKFKKAILEAVEETNVLRPNGFTLTFDKGNLIDVENLILRPNGMDFEFDGEKFVDENPEKFFIIPG